MTHQDVAQRMREYRDRGYPGVGGVEIDYTNWRGERSTRRILPDITSLRIVSATGDERKYHPEGSFVFDAWDLDKMGKRTFAAEQVHSWKILGSHEVSGYEQTRDASNLPHKTRRYS